MRPQRPTRPARWKRVPDGDGIAYSFSCGWVDIQGTACSGLLGTAIREHPLPDGSRPWTLTHPKGIAPNVLLDGTRDGRWKPTNRRGTRDRFGHRRGIAKDGTPIGRRQVAAEIAGDALNEFGARGHVGDTPNLPVVVVCPDCRRNNLVDIPDAT